MSIVAVTGASGHVGGALVRLLLAQGHQVRALVYKDRRALEGLPVECVPGDIHDPEALDTLLRGADCLHHSAALISFNRKEHDLVLRTNIDGVRSVVDAVLRNGVGRMVHYSSIHAFDQFPLQETLDESRGWNLHSDLSYDISKVGGERVVVEAISKRGLPAVILNPTSVMGGYDFKPSAQGQALLDFYHRRIPALTRGGFNWVDVRDVAEAGVAAMEKGQIGERYIVAGTWHSMQEIAAMVEELTGAKAPAFTVPIWLAQLTLPLVSVAARITGKEPMLNKDTLKIILEGNMRISGEKCRRELGIEPRPIREAIRHFFADQGIVK